MPEINFEAVLGNNKLRRSVRYAMIREHIVKKAQSRREKRDLLLLVGHELKGTLVPGTPYYWSFIDGTRARFQ